VAEPTPAAPVAPAPETAAAIAEGLPRARGPTRSSLRRLLRDRAALAGLVVIGVAAIAAAAAPLFAPYSSETPHYAHSLQGPGRHFLLGTDGLGRDELSRLLYGARISLASVTVATLAIVVVGVAVGLVSGYFGGLIDSLLQRTTDVVLAFPSLVLALVVAGILGPSLSSVVIAVVSVHWASYARLVRGMVLAAREQRYVEASLALGARDTRVMLAEILPNVLPPVVVLATLEMGGILLAISSLSFLGLGAQPPTPEWGTMLNEARPYFESHAYLMIIPGAAITLLVLAFNLVGDGLRDALDPRASSLVSSARRRRWRPLLVR
jgi:peptide/nickel transport system permease protein